MAGIIISGEANEGKLGKLPSLPDNSMKKEVSQQYFSILNIEAAIDDLAELLERIKSGNLKDEYIAADIYELRIGDLVYVTAELLKHDSNRWNQVVTYVDASTGMVYLDSKEYPKISLDSLIQIGVIDTSSAISALSIKDKIAQLERKKLFILTGKAPARKQYNIDTDSTYTIELPEGHDVCIGVGNPYTKKEAEELFKEKVNVYCPITGLLLKV